MSPRAHAAMREYSPDGATLEWKARTLTGAHAVHLVLKAVRDGSIVPFRDGAGDMSGAVGYHVRQR